MPLNGLYFKLTASPKLIVRYIRYLRRNHSSRYLARHISLFSSPTNTGIVKRIVIHFIPHRPAFAAIADERQLDKAGASPASGRIRCGLNCFPARQFYRARSSFLFDDEAFRHACTTNGDEFYPSDASRIGLVGLSASARMLGGRDVARECTSRRD